MLKKVRFENFRCFEDHEIKFGYHSLLVGKNNAGKSTCIEGLRLISLITQRLGGLAIKDPPTGMGLSKNSKGVSPSLDSISIQRECIFFRYGDPPAKITAVFTNGSSIEVHVGEKAVIHAVIKNAEGRIAKNKATVNSCDIPIVKIMPQIGPVQNEETMRADATVKKGLQTNLSSLHFRNQIRLLKDEFFDAFRELTSETWPGLRIEDLVLPDPLDPEGQLALIVRDGDFSAEIAWMGHGMQMWLQTVWFLARSNDSQTIILDEPDVYMHADLQRRLIRMLLKQDRQFIVATHSAEMMAEVNPESIVILDRSKRHSNAATSNEAVQNLLNSVGSIHNLSLARMAIHKKIVFVEGKDIPLLKRFQDIVGLGNQIPIDALPSMGIGGWTKWQSVLTFAEFYQKHTPGEFSIFCAFDRDYHTNEEVQSRYVDAASRGIALTIWDAKELENYTIRPNPLHRLLRKKGLEIDINDIKELISSSAKGLRDHAIDAIAEELKKEHKGWDATKINPLARDAFSEREAKLGIEMVVHGKNLRSAILGRIQQEYAISISTNAILCEFQSEDVHPDLLNFLKSIES